MGWWSADIMGGDTPLDLEGVICDVMGIKFDFEGGGYKYNAAALNKHRDAIVKCIEARNKWWSHKRYRDIGYQVLGYMILTTGARITKKLRARIAQAAMDDEWAAEGDEERSAIMSGLARSIRQHRPGVQHVLSRRGLLEVIAATAGGA